MNRYPDLSNTERARILCQLFAAQIPEVLAFIAKESAALLENPAAFKYRHDERLFSFERLLSLAREVKSCLHKARRKDPVSLFISLFDGYQACYTAQLLAFYPLKNEPARERLVIAVRLLFME